MQINFRQGILRARSVSGQPDFLVWNNAFGTVDINITDPYLIVCASYQSKEYIIEERADVAMAWGPFNWNPIWGAQPTLVQYSLYWDINLATGNVTRGYSPWVPYSSATAPPNQRIDQHWYNTSTNVTMVWDSQRWKETCRVFAGSFTSSAVMNEFPFGSQVGIVTPIEAGFIMYGPDNVAIRQSDGTFYTSVTESRINTGAYSSPVKGETMSTTLIASEPIPAFYCVTNVGSGLGGLADPNNPNKYPIGIATTQTPTGQVIDYCYEGFVYNDQWNWNFALGKDLYCGPAGLIYQGQPTNGITGGFKVGTIINATSIQVSIDIYIGTSGQVQPANLLHDVTVIGTNVGAVSEPYTFPQGMTFTQFVDVISKKILPPSYANPALVLVATPPPTQLEVGTFVSPNFSMNWTQGDSGPLITTALFQNSVNIGFVPLTSGFTLSDINPQNFYMTLDYGVGPVKLDNMGTPTGTPIPAGSLTSNSITFIGTRAVFFGTPSATPTDSIGIRALQQALTSTINSGVDATGSPTTSNPTPNFIITIPVGATQVVFAYPATLRNVASVKYQEFANTEVKDVFTVSTVSVAGAAGFPSINYKVYTYIPVEPYSVVNHYQVFI